MNFIQFFEWYGKSVSVKTSLFSTSTYFFNTIDIKEENASVEEKCK